MLDSHYSVHVFHKCVLFCTIISQAYNHGNNMFMHVYGITAIRDSFPIKQNSENLQK